mgnify:CR=1 FL=1
MITRLKVKNYRSIEEIDLPLSPLTVLVGKNGAGKSTILDVLAFVRDALTEGLGSAIRKRGDVHSIVKWTPNQEQHDIEVALFFDSNRQDELNGSYSFTYGKFNGNAYEVKQEECVINQSGYKGFRMERFADGTTHLYDNLSVKPSTAKYRSVEELGFYLAPFSDNIDTAEETMDQVKVLLTDTEVYNIPPENIRSPQARADDAKLWGDGKNLASVLYRLQSDEATFGRIRSALHQIVPNVEDIRVRGLDDYYSISLKHHRKDDAEAWFSLRHESDGTLRALALLTALYQDYTHSCIAIEEPETAIFSRNLGIIADALYEATLRRQVIITTQSPDLISCFAADDLRIVTEVDGATTAGTLDKTQLRIIEKELFNAGELLRLEGLFSSSIPRGEEVVA